MVAEIVIALRVLADTVFPWDNGRATQGWLYHTLAAGNADVASEVHGANVVPYTCSALMTRSADSDGLLYLAAGEPLSLRVTTLDAATAVAFDAGLRACNPELHFSLPDPSSRRPRELSAQIVDATVVRTCAYGDFRTMARSRHWRLSFRSRTAFEHGEQRVLLPIPALVVSNLTRKWNAFCQDEGLAVDRQGLLNAVEENVAVSEIAELRTEPFGESPLGRGFVGAVTLSVLSDLPRPLFAQFAALMHYVRFAGVGQRTTEGWGQVEVTW